VAEVDDELAAWEFHLPDSQIARTPSVERDRSRLLVVPREGGAFEDREFRDLPDILAAGDRIVANDTRVMAARLFGRRATGGEVEILVLSVGPGPVDCLVRPARKVKDGERVRLDGGGEAILRGAGDRWRAEFDRDPADVMASQGRIPLPPYLGREDDASDRDRYQTVFAGPLGSCAAPTAGLHVTPAVLDALARRNIDWSTVTLHVGLGTFRPLSAADLETGYLHTEPYVVPDTTARGVAATRAAGGRVIALGTTSCRTLESAAQVVDGAHTLRSGAGTTRLFIRPGYRFRSVDGLITNFHLPRSSLLMLVASLIGRDRLFAAYEHAISRGYRFFSYGDAMLVV
jgi:S-adenosylmethionine:tRNA ribosyltransferase-isomerase